MFQKSLAENPSIVHKAILDNNIEILASKYSLPFMSHFLIHLTHVLGIWVIPL